jgi:tRNA A37 threonylcarbamoyladenosine dehydratase
MTRRALTDDEALRLGRNVLLHEIGLGGQETLRGACVQVTELGAVGSAASLYLVAAGIVALRLDDQRPVAAADLAGTLYRAADVGRPRLEAARDALAALDPAVAVGAAPAEIVIEARDQVEDGCTLDVKGRTVAASGGPGPQALLAGALAAAEAVKALLGLGAPIRAAGLP